LKNKNEYDYLKDEALRRSKQGRGAIISAERKFHDAVSRIRQHLYQVQSRHLDEILEAISDYPSVLRSVLDADAEANQMLLRAMHIRRSEVFEKHLQDKSAATDAAEEV
jgi:hypothetical protein